MLLIPCCEWFNPRACSSGSLSHGFAQLDDSKLQEGGRERQGQQGALDGAFRYNTTMELHFES